MGFEVKVPPQVAERIAGWILPEHVVRQFYLQLADDLEARSAPQRVEMTEAGMRHTIAVQDVVGRHYVFVVHLTRSDMDFQVNQCSCLGIDEHNNIFWSSQETL